MRNKRVKRPPVSSANLYGLGSQITQGWQGMGAGQKASALGSVTSGLLGPATGGTETKAGNIMGGIGSTLSAIPTPFTQIAGAGLSVLGGLTNAAFGTKWNDKFIAGTESGIEEQANTQWDASSNTDLLNSWDDFNTMNYVSESQVGKDGWFSNKAKDKAEELNAQIDDANKRAIIGFNNRVEGVDTQNDLATAANFAALGGYLLSKGGNIHIKKSNKGKFTEYCGGKVTSACIQKGKRSNNPAIRKRATFAQNARGWNHAFGGALGTNGTDWTNGVDIFNVGGTHEENPNQGIPQGVDENGVPNLVEEGEVKFNDYIYSNRIQADKSFLEMVGLPKKYKGKTYAKLAEIASKESQERPNDPISKRGLNDSMLRLQIAQEGQRAKNQDNKFAKGGRLYKDGTLLQLDKDMADVYEQGVSDLLSQYANPSVKGVSSPTEAALPTWMRYAPTLGGALGALSNTLTPVDDPDYSDADSILRNRDTVAYTPLTQKLSYKPFDKEFYQNKLSAQAGATRRGITNAANGNRGALIAGLIGSDYNTQNQMGNLFRQAEEYNQAQKERITNFNRQTDQLNSQMGIQTGMFNSHVGQQAASEAARLKMIETQRYRMDQAAKRDAIAANLSNLFESLGGIGEENYWRNAIESNPIYRARIDSRGTLSYKKSKGGKLKLKL